MRFLLQDIVQICHHLPLVYASLIPRDPLLLQFFMGCGIVSLGDVDAVDTVASLKEITQ